MSNRADSQNLPAWAQFGLAGAVAAIHGTAPLYDSNQHTYLLHTVAPTHDRLRVDWLAGGDDSQANATVLTRFLYENFGPVSFHCLQLLLATLGIWGLWKIVSLTLERFGVRESVLWFALLAIVFVVGDHLIVDVRKIAIDGLAGMRVFGRFYQGSEFGLLLFPALALFLTKRPIGAALLMVLAAAMHVSYVIVSAEIGLAIATWALVATARERRLTACFLITLCGGIGALTIDTWLSQPLTSSEISARAAEIVVHERIPHHAVLTEWFGLRSGIKAVVLAGILYQWRYSTIGIVLIRTAFVALVSTVCLTAIDHDRLLLLLPHRAFVFIFPVATSLTLAYVIRYSKFRVHLASLVRALSSLLGIVGLSAIAIRLLWPIGDAEPVLRFLSTSVAEGGLVLQAPPGLREDVRLMAGVPVFVDYKSHPFLGAQVLEWWKRIELSRRVYEEPTEELLNKVCSIDGVSHILASSDWTGCSPAGVVVYEDEDHKVCRLSCAE